MFSEKTVLIVEEDDRTRDILRVALEMSNFNCLEAADAQCAHGMIIDQKPDLVLLDSLLPGQTGIELARRLRRDEFTATIPIVMLTLCNRNDIDFHEFDVGADDYIQKPIPPRELIARLKSVLRRFDHYTAADPLFACGLCLNPRTHSVTINERLVSIGPTEYRLLEYFLSNQERVHSRQQLLDKVWGGASYVQERTVDVHIRRLRKALCIDGHDRFVQTVRGAGYRFSHKHVYR